MGGRCTLGTFAALEQARQDEGCRRGSRNAGLRARTVMSEQGAERSADPAFVSKPHEVVFRRVNNQRSPVIHSKLSIDRGKVMGYCRLADV